MITGRHIFIFRIPTRLEEGNLRLRPLRFSDGAFLKSGFSRPEGLRAGGLSLPVSASGAAIRRWIRKAYDLAWCVEVDSVPAGFAGIYGLRPGRSAEASLVLFDRTLRRRGYGRRVLRMVSGTLAARAGVRKLSVSVRKDNQSAVLFWSKIGFRSTGCEEDICSMELDL